MQAARCGALRYLSANAEERCFSDSRGNLDRYIDNVMQACGSRNTSGAFCKHCKQQTLIVKLLQTRSADEGMTAIGTCSRCRKQYRI